MQADRVPDLTQGRTGLLSSCKALAAAFPVPVDLLLRLLDLRLRALRVRECLALRVCRHRRSLFGRAASLEMRPICDHDRLERPGIPWNLPERRSGPKPTIWLCTGQSAAPPGTTRNAPDRIR